MMDNYLLGLFFLSTTSLYPMKVPPRVIVSPTMSRYEQQQKARQEAESTSLLRYCSMQTLERTSKVCFVSALGALGCCGYQAACLLLEDDKENTTDRLLYGCAAAGCAVGATYVAQLCKDQADREKED